MALDALVDSAQLDSDLKDVADAIREKSGGTGSLTFPSGFVSEIENIQGGNETAILSRTLSGTYTNYDVTHIANYMLQYQTGITAVVLPNLITMGANVFVGDTGLLTASLIKFQSGGGYAFMNCTSLTTITVPKYADVLANFCEGCTSLTTVDSKGQILRAASFKNCSSLTTLILRHTGVSNLTTTSAFEGTPFAQGGTGGTIYVPRDLISSYQTATNWSTLYGYGTVTFSAIEDSEYADTYADGTEVILG